MAETEANGHRSAPLRVVFLTGRDHPLTAGLLARLHATPGISLQQVILWPQGWQAQAALAAACRDLQIPLHVCRDVTEAGTIALIKNLDCNVIATCATSAVAEVIARIPSAGCLGLYHGDAPAWTGASNVFWALWNRAAHVSAAVALPGDGRNSEVVCRQTIPLCSYDDLTSCQAKLDELSMSIYPRALREMAAGRTDHSNPVITIQRPRHPNLAQKLTLHVRLFFSRLNLYQLVRRFVRDSGYLVVLLAEKVKIGRAHV